MPKQTVWVLRAPTFNERRNEQEFKLLANCIRRDERFWQANPLLVVASPGCLWAAEWLARNLGVEAIVSPWADDEVEHLKTICSNLQLPLVVLVTDRAAIGGVVLSPGSTTTIKV